MDYGYIKKNLEALKTELSELQAKYKNPITLVAVTKSGSDDELLALASYGIENIGENRPGELKRRGELLLAAGYTPALHEIGNLQRNKVKYIIDKVSLIHSLDNIELAKEINKRAEAAGRVVPVLIEINSAEEPQKDGVMPSDAMAFYEAIKDMPNISVRGLMTMGPVCEAPEDIRPYFRLTKQLFDKMKAAGCFTGDGVLSMGMSDSYRVAIEEGATLVRVGRRLFIKD
ncbi:MAG: YggS family pyridoxal phosphate-dependent enzyme [Clostridia bacterium]|nr:YggS family pyridoxal phosphate-dependent enzyme [Clostridia bacterium]